MHKHNFSRLKGLFVSLLLVTLLSSCNREAAMEGRSFEGTITQVIKMPGLADMMAGAIDSGGESKNSQGLGMLKMMSNITMKAYIREDKLAYEMNMMGGLMKARAIIDRTNRTLTVLSPDNHAIVTDFKMLDTMRGKLDDSIRAHQKDLDSLADMTPKPTGKKSVINGFDVEEFTGKMHGMDVQIWATEDQRMKQFDVIRDAVLGRMKTGTGGLEEVFSILGATSSGKIPVKAEAKLNGKVVITSELTDIDEGKVDDAMFEVPKDYEIIKPDLKRDTSGAKPKDRKVTGPES